MSEEATGNGHQQERGSEMKDFLFIFKVLSFEQRVQVQEWTGALFTFQW